MLALHKQFAAANTPNEKAMLQRQIDATDAQIDALVYALYGLTEEKIKIVEGADRHTTDSDHGLHGLIMGTVESWILVRGVK